MWSSCSALMLAAAAAVGAQVPAAAPPVREPAPLFASDSAATVTIRAQDLRTLLRDRDSTERRSHPGTLTYTDGSGASVTLPIDLRTRGHFRRQTRNCDFPPLRVRLGKEARGTLFDGQKRLKLVTPCRRRRADYEQYLLREYLAYRIYNLLTPLSFRARLLRITYQDARGREEPITTWAFFIEDDDDLAKRIGGSIIEVQGAVREDLVATQRRIVALFQYLIGNTDWSIAGLHNIKLVQTQPGTVYPIPYDFDFAGVVAPPYAIPDPTLPIQSVREPLFRGYCGERVDEAIALLNSRREAIYALYRGIPALDPQTAERTHRFFDRIYEDINDPETMRVAMRRRCVK